MLGAVCSLFVLLLLLELTRELREALLILREDGVNGEVDVAVGSYAAELLGDVMDYGLAAVVEIGLAKVPLLAVADHGVKLVHSGNESKLGVFQHLGISAELVCKSMPSPYALWRECRWPYPRGNCLNSVFFLVPAVHTRPSSLHLLHGNSPSHYPVLVGGFTDQAS